MAFGNSIIKRRVMAEVEKRIETAQKTYDTKTAEYDKEYNKSLDELSRQLYTKKDDLVSELVSGILGSRNS